MRTAVERWIAGVALVALVAGSGSAWPQQDVPQRLDALQALSEKDNAAALTQLTALGSTLGPSTPYAVQRQYLTLLMSLEVAAARMDAAEINSNRLLKLAQDQGDSAGVVLATAEAANLLNLAGKTDAAIAKLADLEPTARRTNDPEALWSFYSVRSEVELTAGQFEAAIASALKSLDYASQQPKFAPLARLKSLNALAKVYMLMTNWDKALAVIEEAIAMAQTLGSTKMLGTLYLNRGYIFSAKDRHDEARAAYEQAKGIGQAAGLVGLQGTALNNICDGYLRKKSTPRHKPYAHRRWSSSRKRASWEAWQQRKAISAWPRWDKAGLPTAWPPCRRP